MSANVRRYESNTDWRQRADTSIEIFDEFDFLRISHGPYLSTSIFWENYYFIRSYMRVEVQIISISKKPS